MTLARGRLIRAAEAPNGATLAVGPDATADLIARLLGESARFTDSDERALDRLVTLSQLLAERLLGKALDLAPETVVELARGVLLEARSARRVQLFVSPAGASVLKAALHDFDPDGRIHEVAADPALGPGDLRLETELGHVDAKIQLELARLAQRLRAVLRS